MAEIATKFTQGLQKLKVKEVGPYTRQFAEQHLTPSKLSSRYNNWFQNYKAKYIDTGSPKPLWDTMAGLFVLSYALAWPQELKHLKAEQAAKLEGKKH